MGHKTSASVSAELYIKPVLSQSVLVTAITASIFSLFIAGVFFWNNNNYGWIFILFSFFIIGLVSFGWFYSQRFIDLVNSNPTIISDKNGNSITTDSRILTQNDGFMELGRLFQSIGAIRPLPEPDGLIDKSGKVINGSKGRAVQKAKRINGTIEEEAQKLTSQFSNSSEKNVSQNKIDIPEESCNEILKYNKKSDD